MTNGKGANMMDAYETQCEWDEGGLYLILDEERFRIMDPEQLYDRVKAAVLPWLMEREAAFSEFRQAVQSGTGPAAEYFARKDADSEDYGYELSDPQHPDFHSVHADIWDARADK